MKALTLHRPWDLAILYCGKRIENRTWRPRSLEVRETFALHEGKYVDPAGREAIRLFDSPSEMCFPGVFALVEFGGVVTESDDPWFFGPVGWVLRNVRPIEPRIVVPGRQGLWEWRETVYA